MAAALEDHQQKLLQSSRLALIGQVAAGVAHEINNPLGVILGFARVARARGESQPVSEPLRIIEEEARECQRIVQELLDLGRPVASGTSIIDLVEIVRETVDRLREINALGKRSVELPASTATALVRADPAALRQVVANLVRNAVDATSETGVIALRLQQDGDFLELEVNDNGHGIAPDALPRVLEPFFTTKPHGTGLGLAICQVIANAHGGTLAVRSEGDSGTEVRLRLPTLKGTEDRAE
jgi:signal transduction histidine kinase